jgi:hypothetical protein
VSKPSASLVRSSNSWATGTRIGLGSTVTGVPVPVNSYQSRKRRSAPPDELVASAAELADDEGLRGYDAVHLAAVLTVEATVLSSADTALCANPLGS